MNKKKDLRNVQQTQFDRGQVLKGSFSELNSALRTVGTNAILKDVYSHFSQVVDVQGRPIEVTYYLAERTAIDELNIVADVSKSLAGTYIILQEFLTKKTQAFYYVVDGTGTAPGIADIETPIAISENDSAPTVCFATKSALDTVEQFVVTSKSFLTNTLTLEYWQFGEVSPINVDSTGFVSNRTQEGISKEVGYVELTYDVDGHPVYNGNPLKGLLYNPYTASFDVERDEVTATVDLNKPTTFDVTNIAVVTAGVEITIVIPDGTKRFRLQSRESNNKLTVTNVTSGDYFTIKYGSHYEEENIQTNGVTLYVTTSRDNRNLELLTWA